MPSCSLGHFDLLWREGALDSLQKLNITGRAYNYIQDFLKNRTFQVRVGESLSDSKIQENGVPQGAVLSPTLFNILIDAVAIIPERYPHIGLGQFADDTAIWVEAIDCPTFGPTACKDLRQLIKKPAEDLIKILSSIGFKVNVKKTQAIFFNKPSKGKEYVQINNDRIEATNTATYLGVTLDSKLTYSEHINKLVSKGEKSLNILRKISGYTWGVHCQSRLLLYKNYILPKMVYGEEFYDKASSSSLEKLQKLQNRALSIISNTRKSLPIAARHFVCQLPPLNIRRKAQILQLHNRLQHNQDNPSNIIFSDNYQNATIARNIPKIKKTYCESVRELREKYNLAEFHTNFMPKPIEYWAINGIQVDTLLKNTINRQLTNIEKLNLVMDHLRLSYPNHIHVYCDGAKNRFTGHTGIGIFDMTNNFRYKVRLNNHLHINTVEVAAASYSSKYLNSFHPDAPSLIITDSLSTCRKLEEFNDSDPRFDLIQTIQKFSHNIQINRGSLSILWVPAHINLVGHDVADELAKQATNNPLFHDLRYSPQELKSITKNNLTKPALQDYWSEARTGTYGLAVVPTFETKINISSLTHPNSDLHLLLRLIFGTAQFHIPRNRGCETCQANLSIEHTLLNCQIFNREREELRNCLNRLDKQLTLENVLSINCHKTVKQARSNLIRIIHNRFTI